MRTLIQVRLIQAGFMAAAVTGLFAQTATVEKTVELPTFTVSSERGNAYRATDSMSAARIRGALIDTPATINVITDDFIKDIGAASLLDATQYVSGIGNGRLAGGSGILDRQTIRGYENDGRTIDNFSSGFQGNLDPLLYERVEIVKGPNSILAPTGTPGGSINVITKSPKFTQESSLSAVLAEEFGNKFTYDTTGPVPGTNKLAYRLIAGYQDTSSFVPGSIHTWSVNPQLTWRISDRSQLTVKGNWVNWGTFGAAQNPSITLHASADLDNGETLSMDTIAPGFIYGKNNGSSADWSYRKDNIRRGTAQFTTAISDNMSLRVAAMRHFDHFSTNSTGLSTPGQSTQSSRYNPMTGIYTPNYTWAKDSSGTYVSTYSAQFNPASITRTASADNNYTNDTQLQADLAGNFNFGGVSLQTVTGGAYGYSTAYNRNSRAAAGQLPNFNLYTQTGTDLPALPTFTLNSNNFTKNTQKQLYAYAKLGFLKDRLLVNAGIAKIWLDVPVTNQITHVQTSRLNGSKNTPLYGVLYKVTPQISAYYSHSTNANAVLYNSQALWRDGVQDEFGVKTEFFQQRLSITASHFDISQNNIVTPNPSYFIDPVNNPQNFKADLANKGFEIDAVGGITKNLTAIASFTDMKMRDAFGRRRRNIPDTMINALLKYSFTDSVTKGLSVFAGVTYVGDQAGEDPSITATPLGVVAQVSFYNPARTIYNAGATYIHGKYRFNLNIENLTDKETFWQPSGRFSLSPYPGFNARLTTTYTF